MKLVSYLDQGKDRLGILVNDQVYDANSLNSNIPNNMAEFLVGEDKTMNIAKAEDAKIKSGEITPKPLSNVQLLAPVPKPTSCRDAYAFRQHVFTARRNRGVEMIEEFDQFPIFYFTNHNAIQGPGEIVCMPDHMERLDFELEISIVVGKKGRNIKASEATPFIAGFCIMNDMSARRLQMEEMKLNLGPAKGKDFSTVIGPYMITPDELEQYKTKTKGGHVGVQHNLEMKCWVNGKLFSEGNYADMDWTFEEILERCAYGADILPGDVIGSGTVGTGCLMELNGSGKLKDPDNFKPYWLKDGDVVDMEITGLGKLSNTIKLVKNDHSLFALKKNMDKVNG
ncbi:MAG: fumarylacetoacetate (FAA) hydrolase [Sphingobacteriales bacterium]|jgi:fumarylacetoacetate (FAA) hydrolase